MNRKLITKKDYEILGIQKNATSDEIRTAYEKLLQEYHPEKIKLVKLREPKELELKKYKEIEEIYKKFDLEYAKYICCGWKGNRPCRNEFYPCLWEKVENGRRDLFCSQECYNSKYENQESKSQYDELVERYKREDKEWERKKLEEQKKSLADWKSSHIQDIQKALNHTKVKVEELDPINRNYEAEINNVTIKDSEDLEYIKIIADIAQRVEKDIYSKKKEEEKKCDHCGKPIKKHREGNTEWVGIGSIDNEGNYYTFCSRECSDKGMKGKGKWVVRKNPFTELLKWMEKEGIDNISVSNGKLALTYSNKQEKTIEDENLTDEQKEIKNFFQTIGKSSLSRDQARAEVEKDKNKGGKSWLGPAIGIGIVTLIVIFIGIIIYKNKKKGY